MPSPINTRLAVLAAAAGALTALPVQAELVTLGFDEICDTCIIEPGYRGLGMTWDNWSVLDVVSGQGSGFASGFSNGLVSPNNVAFNYFGNWNGIRSDTPFALVSGYMTSAFKDGLTARIVGWRQGVQVYEETFDLYTTERQFLSFNPATVDYVEFRNDFNGEDNPFYGGGGFMWALDDLTLEVSAVPEPSSWAMLAAGIAALGVAVRRHRT